VSPRATYRLQLNAGFGFEAAAKRAGYLAKLGVSHVYLSPYLKARVGSSHGYDIVDHSALNPELGDDAAFAHMSQAFKSHALGQILDFVPNHMGVGGADNPLWLDVLEWGPDAPHAGWFDIDWDPDRRSLKNKVLAPLLGDQYGIELERGALRLKYDEAEGSFAIWAYETHKLPVWPPHYARILGDAQTELEQLADEFNWLPNWRQQMPQRAAELKLRLAALVRKSADARTALNSAVARFNGRPEASESWGEMDRLIQEQCWRVAHFRVAADDINYRRFFNINDLAGLRVEIPEVFDHIHQRVFRLVRDGVIDGLRIDHIDGLYDPKQYLRRLHRRLGARRSGGDFYLVVEKILAPHEHLREDWPVDGTTGYDFLNQVLDLLIDSSAQVPFTDCYAEFTGERRTLAAMVRLSKLQIMDNEMASELNVLARDLGRLARENPRTADFTRNLLHRALKELIACFPVYRTYVDGGALDDADQRDLSWALAQARRNEVDVDPSVFDFLEKVASGALARQPRSGFSRTSLLRCAMRLQQYSGPVMAKGLEDTAFYRHHRFIALNEVGGDPDRFGSTVAAFHKANLGRAQRWPRAMLSTATHDTKRGEDTRARLAALSEYPDEWMQQLPVWTRILRGPRHPAEPALQPDRNDEYLLYQVLIGSWPFELLAVEDPADARLAEFAGRIQQTMVKAMREARVHTGWAFPNSDYEKAMASLIDMALTGSRASAFFAAFLPFARRVAAAGVHNSLIQLVVKLTAPGIPDIYNGTELWDLSTVDPDNRRPVDYELRARLLEQIEQGLEADRGTCMRALWRDWHDGQFKLATMVTLLQHRRANADLYARGDYQSLQAQDNVVCGYARTHHGQLLIVALELGARRHERQRSESDTQLVLPEALRRRRWRDVLSGRRFDFHGGQEEAERLFEDLPAAVLEPDEG
jgi:(1->4)-alpha-D-glucan 1-alpha-D-glucosylmutase